MKNNKERANSIVTQMSANSLIGAIVGFGLMGWLCFFPEKDQKVDPIGSIAVAALSASSVAGAIVSAVNLRKEIGDRYD